MSKVTTADVIKVAPAKPNTLQEFYVVFRQDQDGGMKTPWPCDTCETLERAEKDLADRVKNDRRKHFIVRVLIP